MWRRRTPDSKIASRVAKMSQDDLIAWSDQALYSAGRNLTQYQRDGLPEYLDEAETAAAVLSAIVAEIRRRAHR